MNTVSVDKPRTTRIFFKVGHYEFRSDERDIRTSNDYQHIQRWCIDNNIAAKPIMHGHALPYHIWRVENEASRAWFALRWEE